MNKLSESVGSAAVFGGLGESKRRRPKGSTNRHPTRYDNVVGVAPNSSESIRVISKVSEFSAAQFRVAVRETRGKTI